MPQPNFRGMSGPESRCGGYVDEADPAVMEMEIEAAAEHGVNVFIYDWYWFDGMPYLENCLNDGFLKAKNRDKMKFYLMWANHDVNYTWDIRLSWEQDCLIWKGGRKQGGIRKCLPQSDHTVFRTVQLLPDRRETGVSDL